MGPEKTSHGFFFVTPGNRIVHNKCDNELATDADIWMNVLLRRETETNLSVLRIIDVSFQSESDIGLNLYLEIIFRHVCVEKRLLIAQGHYFWQTEVEPIPIIEESY